jgi:hypothetical protein
MAWVLGAGALGVLARGVGTGVLLAGAVLAYQTYALVNLGVSTIGGACPPDGARPVSMSYRGRTVAL